MMIRENDLSDIKILDAIKQDPIGRNQQLNTFISLINSIDRNSFLTIDGDWGSGKSVFVKQLEYLNKNTVSQVQSLDQVAIENFQNKYDVYYFNAWENDYHEDPLQSVLFNLINDIWGPKERISDTTIKISKAFSNSVAKALTLGLYDAEEVRKAENITDLTKSIMTASERKRAIDDIIANHLDLNGKKLLFIIDELDRCKPTYAVNLLEAVKHYYTNDKLVFLLSTNNKQLSHTIKKVYGESFDGGGYLNKFYDLIFNLPSIEAEKYIEYLGHSPANGYYKDRSPYEVASYLGMSMRQINRYYSSLKLIKGFLESTSAFTDREPSAQLVKYVLIPIAYGLRIANHENYDRFVRGDGVDILLEFFVKSETLKDIVGRIAVDDESKDPQNIITELYGKLFDTPKSVNREDYRIRESAETFRKVVLLMNASGTIDDTLDEEDAES